jgi:hypothetical protein
VVESGALLKRCTPKGYPGFESLPHRCFFLKKFLDKKSTRKCGHAVVNRVRFDHPRPPDHAWQMKTTFPTSGFLSANGTGNLVGMALEFPCVNVEL